MSSLARIQDTSAITSAIAHLGGLLRYALEATSQKQVYLEEEIRFTENYIALQKSRFEGCFEFELGIQLLDSYSLCPPFCIQTLVENVFSHNDMSQAKPISIRVKITEQNALIQIEVENSPRIPSEFESTGTGLQNLKERLYLLYGKDADINLIETHASFTATIIFPAAYEHN